MREAVSRFGLRSKGKVQLRVASLMKCGAAAATMAIQAVLNEDSDLYITAPRSLSKKAFHN